MSAPLTDPVGGTVWISRRPAEELEAESARPRAGAAATRPLAGVTLAVKDNMDVAGLPTTCAHPAYARVPGRSAAVVERLLQAGLVVAGKTNMDQFATGLVGTRSPYGVVGNAVVPGRISGGSSSGSAVAVALGQVDVALGTDTAGSGRVPAALNGIVGFKPTRGLLPTTGVVPACRSIDCVSVFAPSVRTAFQVVAAAAGPDDADPWSRPAPADMAVVPAGPLRVGVPPMEQLDGMDPQAVEAWAAAVKDLERVGTVSTIDVTPYLAAGDLLYGGALVAERFDAFGRFLGSHPEGADPVVAAIAAAAGQLSGASYVHDVESARLLGAEMRRLMQAVDLMALPTVGLAPTLDEVAADPVGVNQRLGRFTTGCNIVDLCGVAVPAGARADGVPFGITLFGLPFSDLLIAAAGTRFLGEPDPAPPPWARWAGLVVVGAHMRGQPLERELLAVGGRFVAEVRTAPEYRLFALPTHPSKPGLVRTGGAGVAIAAELWHLPVEGFGEFVRQVPSPLTVGPVRLEGGGSVPGFLCEAAAAADGATDISASGGWRRHLGVEPPRNW